jgi:hypothetical protein
MKSSTHPFALILIIFVLTLAGWSQNTAELRGKVVDQSGHPVVSAFVIVVGQGNNFMRGASTDDSGDFDFTALPVGSYTAQVKAEGLQPFDSAVFRASIGQVVSFRVVMGVKESSLQSTGGGQAGMVETANSQIGVVMDGRLVSELPLKARDTFALLQLQPGVQSALGADLFFGGNLPGVVSVNGGRPRSNDYLVNGGYSSDQMVNSPSIQPSPDSISEFRILSHNYDADSGRNSGSVLNVITRSGNNALHGSMFEFLRNNVFNSKGYFDGTTPDFKQNDFGATVGGPLRRDKTFFFASYEGQRVRQGITSDAVTVPTAAERSGDFSSGAAFAGSIQNQAVADALNSRAGCGAAILQRSGVSLANPIPQAGLSYASIFPGNVIPQACFDPTAAALLNNYVPNATDGGSGYEAAPVAQIRKDQATFRLDHSINYQQQLSFYYYGADGYDQEPFSTFQGAGADVPGFGSMTRSRFQQANLSHTWTINAKTTNELRFVYYRQGQGDLESPQNTNLVQDSCSGIAPDLCFANPAYPGLGVNPGYGANHEGVPLISLAGGFAIGNNPQGDFSQTGNVYQGSEDYTRIFGRHTLKFGTNIQNQRLVQWYYYNINGQFQFTGGGPNDVGFSDLAPNYLLGLPDTYTQGSANALDVRTTQFDFFGQDAWKLKSNVMLTYGLRWEWNTPQEDAGGRIQGFRPGQTSTVHPCQLSPTDPLVSMIGSTDCSPTGAANSVSPLGLVVPGDTGISNGITNNYLRSYAPRLGLAWSPQWSDGWLAKLTGGPGKSSVRLAWGMFYDSNEELILSSFTGEPPYGQSTNLQNVFLSTPYLGQDGTVHPAASGGVLNPAPGTPVDYAMFRPILLYGNFPQNMPSQYAEHYHLTLQREVAKDTLLQVGYVGSQGHRLLATVDQNPGNPQTCLDLNQIPGMSCGPFGADTTYVIPANAIPAGVTVHLPYGSVPTVTGPNANPITLVGLRKYSSPMCEPTTGVGCPPDGTPVFSSIFTTEPIASSAYNSLQALLSKRFSHGLELIAAYTWSKSLDDASSFEESVNPLDPGSSRSPSLFDARHRLVLSYFWQLPGWKTTNWNWVKHVTTGWGVSGITTIQSGFPIRITSTSDRELLDSYDYETIGRPDLVAPFQRLSPQSSGGYYFAPTSFADAALGQIGNAPRTMCCGPGIVNFDFAVHKSIPLTEGKNLDFRTEIFNLFNHTQFFNPDGNISDGAAFGQVTRAQDPRLIQFALRLMF